MQHNYKNQTALCVWLLLLSSSAIALEGGGAIYPPGIVTVMSGAVPPPGETFIYSYNKSTRIDSIRDNRGDKVFPKAKGTINAHALRLVHTFKDKKILNGNVSILAILPYINGHTNIPALGPNERSSNAGIADPLVGFMLSWTSPGYMHNVEFNYAEPAGKYDEDDAINPGTNTRAIFAAYAFTWSPIVQIDISSKISANYYFENKKTDYHNGFQVVMDFGLNYRFDQHLMMGIGGFISTQLTDDEQYGEKIGNRTRSTKVGPQIGYATRDWGIVGSYQYDVYTRNTSGGNALMLNGFYRF